MFHGTGVSKFNGPGGASIHTGRCLPVRATITFGNYFTVGQAGNHSKGTRHLTGAAAQAAFPGVFYDIFFPVKSPGGASVQARRVFTVMAVQGYALPCRCTDEYALAGVLPFKNSAKQILAG